MSLLRDRYIRSQLRSQRSRCAICDTKLTRRRTGTITEEGVERDYACLDRDHNCDCHSPNGCPECWRSVICNRCNLGIGLFNDNIRLLAAIIVYLQDWSESDPDQASPGQEMDPQLPLPDPQGSATATEN